MIAIGSPQCTGAQTTLIEMLAMISLYEVHICLFFPSLHLAILFQTSFFASKSVVASKAFMSFFFRSPKRISNPCMRFSGPADDAMTSPQTHLYRLQ